jgi:hypothetical protein
MMSLVALLITGVFAAAPQQLDVSDVALERLRAALDKPPSKLTLTDRKPDFTVTISERARFEHLLPPILDFKVGPGLPPQALFTSPFGSQPLFRVDLLSIGMAAVAGVNELRKARARRSAWEEVRRTIAEFCAAQPDDGAGIQICASAPAIR